MQLDSCDSVYCIYVQCGGLFTSQVNDVCRRTSGTWPVSCVMQMIMDMFHRCVHVHDFNLPFTCLLHLFILYVCSISICLIHMQTCPDVVMKYQNSLIMVELNNQCLGGSRRPVRLW